MISIIYGSSTSNWKPWKWMRLDLIFMMRDMYINSNLDLLTKFSTRSRSTEFKGILPWNISQVITKTVPISIRIAISCAMKRVIPFCVWRKNDGNWDKNMIRVSLSREGDCRTNTSAIRNKSKRAGLWESKSRIRIPNRKVKHLRKVVWDKNYNRVRQVYQIHQNRLTSPYKGL